jgi:dipeptidyl aminopeptidase/acylaminoacyl peptidase
MKFIKCSITIIALTLILANQPVVSFAGEENSKLFSPADLFNLKICSHAEISPNGKFIAYTVNRQREATDDPGGSYNELYLVSVEDREVKPFITGKVNVSSPRFSPDGSTIAFISKRKDDKNSQVWAIPVDGGEAVRITDSPSSVRTFRWHPGGKMIAYVATTEKSETEKKLEEKGYQFIYFEENLKHRNIYLKELNRKGGVGERKQLTEGVTVWDFEFSHDGETIAAAISPKNLIDHYYMFKKIYLIDLDEGKTTRLTDNQGKLGNFAFSPDNSRIAFAAARERKDHHVSQAFVIDIDGKNLINLTKPDFRGHVLWVGWKDKDEIVYRCAESVWSTLSTVDAEGGERKIILDSRHTGVIFATPSYTEDFDHFAFAGNTPQTPGDVYYWEEGWDKPKKVVTLNPWISQRGLGKQKAVSYSARDGLELEGLLVYPVGYQENKLYPMVVSVHGGPESNYLNGWLTRYFNPAQVLAGKGYFVFFPNYRTSTGYGVDVALQGYQDAAGKEFDDIADGIDHLISKKLIDPGRIGLGGGSYGGYAAAWFATYYTEYVEAVCMFVGISDLISKRGTTDIPYEELYVHSREKLEKMWDLSLKRSPIYYTHQSKTAVLILGGKADTRVNPSQSLEFYRRLKMNNHPAVRLVQYPGEGHGNRRQPGRIDVLYRTLQWYNWYVRDRNPISGPKPPLDISEHYGLDIGNNEENDQ